MAGTAAGTSVDLAKLGVDVLAMGAIGEDAAGNFIVDTMQRYGIDTSGLRRKPHGSDLGDDAALSGRMASDPPSMFWARTPS